MMKLSAFADEISPDLDAQIKSCIENNVTHFELRGVNKINVLDFDKALCNEIKTKLHASGLGVISIASPVGKVKITDPWEPHFERFKIAVQLAEFFSAPFIRVFSYYPPTPGGDILGHREEVMRRFHAKIDYVKNHKLTILHENEKEIFGEKGAPCVDLMKTINSPKLKSAFDFANFIQGGERPMNNWPGLKPYSVHIHIKDAIFGTGKVVPAGMGDGSVEEILVDLHKSGYDGFLSLEPHLAAAEQFSGFSGPALFKVAADALKALLRKNNIPAAGVTN